MAKIILDNHKLLGKTPDGFQVGSEKVGEEDVEKTRAPKGGSDKKV